MGAKIDEQLIMERTGHSSTTAVRLYKRPDAALQREISGILDPPMPKIARVNESGKLYANNLHPII